jgi:hypothetical protein
MRFGEISDDDLVYAPASFIDQLAEYRVSRLKLVLQPQHRRGDLLRIRSRETHHTDATAAGSRRDRDNSVV